LETKRLIIAFSLSAAVMILWTVLFPPKPDSRAPTKPATAATTPAPAANPTTGAPAVATAPAPARVPARAPVAVTPVAAAAEEAITIERPFYTAVVTNRGGALRSFVLKKYLDATGKPLDLVRHGSPYPGVTLTLDASDTFLARAAAALFEADKTEADGVTTVRFRYREADGSGIVRTWVFRSEYQVSAKVEREGGPALPVALVLGPGIGNPSAAELSNQYTKPGTAFALVAGGAVTRKPRGSLKEPLALGAGLAAAGIEDIYFVTAFLPGAGATATLRSETLPAARVPNGAPAAGDAENVAVLAAAGTLDTDLYLGPKEISVLEKVRPGLDKLIDFGWFAILVKPLLFGLEAIQRVVKNWGVAIILITIVIKVLLFPLTHKQLVSMKKMSALQPKMEAIRAKYATKIKNDPGARLKMNEETMALYKQEGVNPAGGCLPLLLQMPILIAFYNLLSHAIELRHAPFMLWITDLSVKDPYYITPILMTLTMWLQQQMTPPTGDAAMRRVMNLMPFMMGFFFKDVPAGLVLYWLVQNVLTIVQQMLLNRFTDLGPASMKKAGGKAG